jgi:membrane-associated phospholipid phosphatase
MSKLSRKVYLSRAALIAASLAIWFGTQAMLARRKFPNGGIGDGLFQLTAGMNGFLQVHPAWADRLLIASSLGIDGIGIFLLLRGALGPTIRPFLGLLVIFALRQICQGLVSIPAPPGMIWRDPGFPTLLVTYGVSTDLFFSAHTALAVFGATELARFRRRSLTILGIALVLFEATTVIVLRAHYTMDVFAGAVTALWVASFVDRLASPVDRVLGSLGREQTAA